MTVFHLCADKSHLINISVNRFSLSVQLVCGEERWAWGRLLEKLQLVLSDRPQDLAELNVTEWTIVQLKAKFNL